MEEKEFFEKQMVNIRFCTCEMPAKIKGKNQCRMRKIRAGHYRYKGFIIINHGYYAPDKCVWWEAIDELTNEASYHAHTKKDLKNLIDGAE